jgi:ABC-type nitrate/sulfonate/bicarbonate transport system substrate-binding protein
VVLAACGSSTSSPAEKPDNVTRLTIGALKVGDYGPSDYAKAKGFFEAECLDVTVQPIQGGAVEAAL